MLVNFTGPYILDSCIHLGFGVSIASSLNAMAGDVTFMAFGGILGRSWGKCRERATGVPRASNESRFLNLA